MQVLLYRQMWVSPGTEEEGCAQSPAQGEETSTLNSTPNSSLRAEGGWGGGVVVRRIKLTPYPRKPEHVTQS